MGVEGVREQVSPNIFTIPWKGSTEQSYPGPSITSPTTRKVGTRKPVQLFPAAAKLEFL